MEAMNWHSPVQFGRPKSGSLVRGPLHANDTLDGLSDDGHLIVSLDLHQHVCPGPVPVVVLQRGNCHPLVLQVFETHILTLNHNATKQPSLQTHSYNKYTCSLNTRVYYIIAGMLCLEVELKLHYESIQEIELICADVFYELNTVLVIKYTCTFVPLKVSRHLEISYNNFSTVAVKHFFLKFCLHPLL